MGFCSFQYYVSVKVCNCFTTVFCFPCSVPSFDKDWTKTLLIVSLLCGGLFTVYVMFKVLKNEDKMKVLVLHAKFH